MEKTQRVEDQTIRLKSAWEAKFIIATLVKAGDRAQTLRSCESYPVEAQILALKKAIKTAVEAAVDVMQSLVEGTGNKPFCLALLLLVLYCAPAAAQSQYFNSYMGLTGEARSYPGSDQGAGGSGFSSGAFPVYRYPRMTSEPNIPGPTVFLMPDGGTWMIGPPMIDGFIPPPVYTPPDDNYYHHGRHRRHRF
jgi:hypothetical protein